MGRRTPTDGIIARRTVISSKRLSMPRGRCSYLSTWLHGVLRILRAICWTWEMSWHLWWYGFVRKVWLLRFYPSSCSLPCPLDGPSSTMNAIIHPGYAFGADASCARLCFTAEPEFVKSSECQFVAQNSSFYRYSDQ